MLNVLKRLIAASGLLVMAAPAIAQSDPSSTTLPSSLVSWVPWIAIIGFWIFLMRRFGFKKGGYAAVVETSQVTTAQGVGHLARIADSLERIAGALESNRSNPSVTKSEP